MLRLVSNVLNFTPLSNIFFSAFKNNSSGQNGIKTIASQASVFPFKSTSKEEGKASFNSPSARAKYSFGKSSKEAVGKMHNNC